MSEFRLEISNPRETGYMTAATLELPATWSEYVDAMEKARIDDDFRETYHVEILDIKRRYLAPHIPEKVKLLELNLLARRLEGLTEQECSVFSAMVSIEGRQQTPLPLSRLINFTHSVGDCRVAYGVRDDVALGKWLYENDMLPEEVRNFAAARVFWGSETEEQRFGLIGARHRQSHYKKNIAAELETALSIITTAYLRGEDIQTAVAENISYLNPPVLSVFRDFLARIRLVDPDVSAALQDMKLKIENDVFREWCDVLAACQHDRGLKTTLTPIVAKLSDMRIVNGELENLITEPRKEFIIMQVLLVGNIPLARLPFP